MTLNVFQRQRALQEALKSSLDIRPAISDEMKQMQSEMRLPNSPIENLLTLPRNFSRQSSRFELPLDSRQFNSTYSNTVQCNIFRISIIKKIQPTSLQQSYAFIGCYASSTHIFYQKLQTVRSQKVHTIFIVSAMTPLQYIQRYVYISSGRRQLYNTVFNRHKEELEERQILGKVYKRYFIQ